MSDDLNYYDLLEVSPKASQAVIASAYRALSQRYHPDKNGGNKTADEMMAKINVAYAVLSDQLKRKVYDEELVGRGASGKGYSDDVRKSKPAANVSQPKRADSISTLDVSRSNETTPKKQIENLRSVFVIFVVFVIILIAIYLGSLWQENAQQKEYKWESWQREAPRDNDKVWEFAENLLRGDFFPQNYEKALTEYTSISNSTFSDGRAEQRIAEMHFYGLGVPVDYQKALTWYEKVRSGTSASSFMLGVMYERGLGVQADPIAAYHYFNKAQALSSDLRTIPPNPMIREKEKPFLEGASNYRDAAKQRKHRLEKSMTIEQINQAQNR